ncbi:MAG: cupin [Actinomycetota bacterium]|nr:cupin [Actinomycetota bacterium]
MDESELGEVLTTEQPWGKEEVFADVEGRFVGKVLHVRSGERFALQMHLDEEEVLSLMSGAVRIDLGEDADSLTSIVMVQGQTVHLLPSSVHQILATEDSMLLEVSNASREFS